MTSLEAMLGESCLAVLRSARLVACAVVALAARPWPCPAPPTGTPRARRTFWSVEPPDYKPLPRCAPTSADARQQDRCGHADPSTLAGNCCRCCQICCQAGRRCGSGH